MAAKKAATTAPTRNRREEEETEEEVVPRGLLRGRVLARLLATLRPKVEADAARLLAKGRRLNVRVLEYIAAQRGEDVKDAIRWLIGPRKWRYVSFTEFLATLERLVDRLHAMLYDPEQDKKGGGVCFVVDSLNKSSFWIVLMTLLMRPFPGASMAIDDVGLAGRGRESLIGDLRGGDTEGMLAQSLRLLPDTTRLVLMDDAAYSGEQLSHFHDVVVAQWRGSRKAGAVKAVKAVSIVVALPFISRPATTLFRRRGTTLMFEETFPGLFERRSAAQILAADLFIEVSSRGGSGSYLSKNPLLSYAAAGPSYPSLYFDVLGILPTNTMFVFEHKIGDSLSIPNRWLKVGQCVPPRVTRAYRVRKEKAQELMTLLRRDLTLQGMLPKNSGAGGAWTPAHRLMLLAAQRTGELLSSSARFRADFFERVALPPTTDSGGSAPAFLPLLSPEFCDAPYRRYVRRHRVARGELGLALPYSGEDIPPCRKPPYKRTSFRRRIYIGGTSGNDTNNGVTTQHNPSNNTTVVV